MARFGPVSEPVLIVSTMRTPNLQGADGLTGTPNRTAALPPLPGLFMEVFHCATAASWQSSRISRVSCGHQLPFLPDRMEIGSLDSPGGRAGVNHGFRSAALPFVRQLCGAERL